MTDYKSSALQNPKESSGAESGACDTLNAPQDRDLVRVVEAWPELPEPIKAGILAMVRAATID